MQTCARVSEQPDGRPRVSADIADRRDAELAALALLCLMFASSTEETDALRPRRAS